jgi:molybdate transport system substrate-binding protein
MARQPALTGISSMATRLVLADFVEAWRSRSAGDEASVPYIESVGGVEAARRVAEGEPFDFVVLADDALTRLGTQGHVDLGTRVEVARSGVAIAVPAGAAHPGLHDEDAVRRAVQEARRIGYSTGPSGAHLAKLLDRWGMTQTLAPRLVQAPPGVPVASLLARGEVDLGFQQFSELVNVPGVQIAGPLPDDIQLVTVFAAACTVACTAATAQRSAVQAFFDFVCEQQGDEIRQRHGMEAPLRA